MKALHRAALIFATFITIGSSFTVLAVERQNIDFCGNKHKNLVRLTKIINGLSNVVVPEFKGIPSKRIESFLRKHTPDIFTDYANAIELMQPTWRYFLWNILTPNKKFTTKKQARETQALELLTGIQDKIKSCFKSFSFEFTPEELQLFNSVALQEQFFMVRSTGVEDGAIANAGGNASIAYVMPNELAVKQAIGEVIASYFGPHSLKNRIGSGEKLSASDLCLPVLIQVLIGEAIDGDNDEHSIPVSGVAYSTNQSLSSSSFQVTEIDAAYGHGEGVVANRVMADRYFVTPSRAESGVTIYPMLYEKNDRLVPHYEEISRSHTLVSCKNNTLLSHKSALSTDQVKQLYTVLKKIEADYGQPMDVEFVVLDKIIYIVQARPAMHVTMNPSYISFNKIDDTDISKPIYGDIIVPGKAEVLIITNPADIIITNTLDEADQMPNSTKCKAVIVSTWASSLSHPAVNFKTYGTPCIMVQSLVEIQNIVAQISPQNPLVFDVQQRCIVLWKNTHKAIQSCVLSGWLEHPINRTFSINSQAINRTVTHANPLPQDGKLINLLENLKTAASKSERKSLLSQIAERINCKLILTEKRIALFNNLCESELKINFEAYKKTVEMLIKEFNASIDQEVDNFELLFYHKMLEAVLYQNTQSQRVLGGYNHNYFLNELYAKQVFFMVALKLGTNNLQFAEFF